MKYCFMLAMMTSTCVQQINMNSARFKIHQIC
jgi:hypothetical protein